MLELEHRALQIALKKSILFRQQKLYILVILSPCTVIWLIKHTLNNAVVRGFRDRCAMSKSALLSVDESVEVKVG